MVTENYRGWTLLIDDHRGSATKKGREPFGCVSGDTDKPGDVVATLKRMIDEIEEGREHDAWRCTNCGRVPTDFDELPRFSLTPSGVRCPDCA